MNNPPHPTHYYATRIPHSDHWRVLQKATDSAGTHYSISGGANGLRVVTAAEAERINSTGKLPPAERPTKDDTDLVAAALGLRASAWAQAVVHLTKPEFNAAINGEQVLKDGKPVDKEPPAASDH